MLDNHLHQFLHIHFCASVLSSVKAITRVQNNSFHLRVGKKSITFISYYYNISLIFSILNNSNVIHPGVDHSAEFLTTSSSASSSETGEREQFYLGKRIWIFLPYFYCVLLCKSKNRDIKEMSNFYSSEQHMLKEKNLQHRKNIIDVSKILWDLLGQSLKSRTNMLYRLKKQTNSICLEKIPWTEGHELQSAQFANWIRLSTHRHNLSTNRHRFSMQQVKKRNITEF